MTDANTASRSLATLGPNGWEILPVNPENNHAVLFGDSHEGRHYYGTTITAAVLSGNTVRVTSTSHAVIPDNYAAVFGLGAEFDGLQKCSARIDGNNYEYVLKRSPSSAPSVAANATSVAQTRYMDRGWFQYANALQGLPFNLRWCLGRSGARTEHLLTHVHRDLAGLNPRLVVASFGQNDAIAGIADDVWQLNMRRLVEAILLYTDELWLTDVPPINAASGNYSVAARDTCLRMNDFIEHVANSAREIRMVPLHNWLVSPTSATGDYITDYTDDDQHISGKAAQKLGVLLAAESTMWPSASRKRSDSILAAKATDATSKQIFPFPLLQGAGGAVGGGAAGTVPTGLTATKTGAGATLTMTAPARADGFGNNCHFVFVSSANNDACDITITTASALASLVTAGDRIQFGCYLSCATLVAISRIDFVMELFVGGVTYTISAANNSGAGTQTWEDDFTDLPLISPEFVIPSAVHGAVTAIQLRLKILATGVGGANGDYSQPWIKILPPAP